MNIQLGLGIALAFAASAAMAGTAQIDSGGSISTLEYNDDGHMRMASGDEGYMLVRDDKLYMVNGAPGEEMVIDATAILGVIGSMVPETGPTASEVGSVDKTGRRETVAGIEGEVWVISYTDEEGLTQSSEVVVSRDRRAAEFRDAMENFARAMLSALGQDPEALNAMDDTFRDEGVGMLRFGDDMKVVSLTSDSVSDSRFVLPAEPTSMAGLGSLFGGGAAASSSSSSSADAESEAPREGGFLGGIFNRQAERQQDQVESRTQQEVDQAADSATDRVLDRVFDGLFGR